ncbi:MAG: nucleotidyl transferase AbiEii/AbiGii toxin family protein [Syntrophomonadaceae bacterium]|jgi:predicted nucleotidyltransferase component of viral defense system
MHEFIMSQDQHALLGKLADKSLLDNFYLAGGTALALHLGHRWSEDLDFFSIYKFDSFGLVSALSEIDDFLVTGQEMGTVHGLMGNVKISFLYYHYSLLEEFHVYNQIKIAGIKDIALMKLIALVQRGTKKDFIDLYFIEREVIRIEKLINLFSDKFKITSYQPMLIYKSLGYFEDADREVTPKMFKKISWEEIKSYFLRRQKELLEWELKK